MDKSRRQWLTGRFEHATDSIRPPWLISPQSFSDDCSRCGECISACETSIIIKGDGGFPEIDFSRGECTFCGDCSRACPEKLFSKDVDTPPWNIKAKIADNCLSLNQVSCRSCEDSCESRAIQFNLAIGGSATPLIDDDKCNGCGACVATCPVNAITIKPADQPNTQAQATEKKSSPFQVAKQQEIINSTEEDYA